MPSTPADPPRPRRPLGLGAAGVPAPAPGDAAPTDVPAPDLPAVPAPAEPAASESPTGAETGRSPAVRAGGEQPDAAGGPSDPAAPDGEPRAAALAVREAEVRPDPVPLPRPGTTPGAAEPAGQVPSPGSGPAPSALPGSGRPEGPAAVPEQTQGPVRDPSGGSAGAGPSARPADAGQIHGGGRVPGQPKAPDSGAQPPRAAEAGRPAAPAPAPETGEDAPAAAAPDGAPARAPASAPDGAPDGAPGDAADGAGRFTVRLANFEGPFDLLLQLISKHKMDVTEVALSKVTNEFMAYLHAMGPDWDLDQTTEFLVVAATLLDLKAARLLPSAEVEDEGDLALLEARDLLFARLLQYRAYKQIAAIFADRLEREALRRPRTVGLEPQHAELLPEVVLSIGPERFARLAVKAMQPRPKPQVYVDHIHAPLVSVREQAEHVISVLRELGAASFAELTRDAPDTLTVVARFLALLELYREKAVALDQEEALGALQVRWTGADAEGVPQVTDEFDRDPSEEPEPTGKQEPGKQEPARKPARRGEER